MKKTILEIYALAICFFCVICFAVCLGIAGYSVIQIANPDFTISSYKYRQYQSNDAYWKSNPEEAYGNKKKDRPSEEALGKRRLAAYQDALNEERRDGSQTLVMTLIVMLVDILTFAIHWLIARRVRTHTAEAM